MTTITHTGRRYSKAEQKFIGCQRAVLGYIASRLPVTEWHKAEDLAQETWTRALSQPRRGHACDDDDVPGWIAHQARIVLRRHLAPVPADDANWWYLTQILGHSSKWPEPREIVPTPAAVFRRTAAPVAVAA
ncbi:hypothetical protein HUF15_40415 [Streptomyces samsunensis]|uniref:hypothetical protein n=1 Tax=Streptomyces malaysiensis TaxID=92644 RepID=UPI00158345C6|nr:hypothetical protein [Streptomyces samsunensis]NUH42885.1 hypothetical protein [Streptomyces samsunensis]